MADPVYGAVGPTDDFQFDPFTADAQDLKRKYLEAITAKLRASTMGADTPMWQVGRNLGADIGAEFKLKDVESKRQELVSRAREMENAALESAPPEIKALVQNPSTRKEGVALLQKWSQQNLDQQAIESSGLNEALYGGGGQSLPGAVSAAGGNRGPNYDRILALSTHGNPAVAAKAKAILESQYFKGEDPSHNVFRVPGGGQREDPVLTQAYLNAHPQPPVTYDLPSGETFQGPRTSGSAGSQPGVAPQPQSQPGVAPQPQGQMPSPGQAQVGWQIPPEVQAQRDQQRLAMLNQENAQIQQEIGRTRDPRAQATLAQEQKAIQFEIAETQKRLGAASTQGAPMPQVQGPGGTPMPQQGGYAPPVPMPPPQTTFRPGTQPGATVKDPLALKEYEKRMELRATAAEKELGTPTKLTDTEDTLARMRDLNKKGVYTGKAATWGMQVEDVVGGFFGKKSQTAVNTEQFDKEAADLKASIIKDYGTGNSISDADLIAVAKRVPDAYQDPRTRAAIIEEIQGKIDASKWENPRIRFLTENGMPLAEAQIRAHDEYKIKFREAEAAKKRQSSALPGTVNALGPPGTTEIPPNPTGAGSTTRSVLPATSAKTASLDERLKAEGGGGIERYGEDLGNSLAQFRNAGPWTKGGREGFTDAVRNWAEGIREVGGQGNREAVPAERARQAELYANEPGYAQSKEFWNVASNPVSWIPAGTVARAGMSGAAIAGLQPSESATDQVLSAIKGGTIGLVLGTAAKAVAPTHVTAEELANRFGVRDVANALNVLRAWDPTATLTTLYRILNSASNITRRVAGLKNFPNAGAAAQTATDMARRVLGQSGGAWETNSDPTGSRYQYNEP